MNFKNVPYHLVAGTLYVIGNFTLTFKGFVFENKPLIPSYTDLKNLEPASWQALAGFCWLTISFLTFAIVRFPNLIPRAIAGLNYLAYVCMITSAYTQEGFWAQTIGILPWFFAAGLLFQGNQIRENGKLLRKYPVAVAGFIFSAGNVGIAYNGFVSGDLVLFTLGIIFIIANIAFAFTDLNFQRKLFGSK